MSEVEDLKRQIAELEAKIEKIEADDQRATKPSEWPIAYKFYSHSGKEDNLDDAENFGFEDGSDEWDRFRRSGYETAFDTLVYEDGRIMATHVNGVALVEPVEL